MKAFAVLAFYFIAVLAICSAAAPAKETLKESAATYFEAYPYSAYGAYPYAYGAYPYAASAYGAYPYASLAYSAYPYSLYHY